MVDSGLKVGGVTVLVLLTAVSVSLVHEQKSPPLRV